MAVRFTNQTDELELFVEWVLADLTERKASGKRPEQAMMGFWMTRPNLPGRSRLSDLTERRYVAMSALIQADRPMADALARVCRHLGQEQRTGKDQGWVLRFQELRKSGVHGHVAWVLLFMDRVGINRSPG